MKIIYTPAGSAPVTIHVDEKKHDIAKVLDRVRMKIFPDAPLHPEEKNTTYEDAVKQKRDILRKRRKLK